MSTPNQSQFDQLVTFVTANYPPLWRNIYLKLIGEGFKDHEALELTKTYILSQGVAPIKP